MCAAAPAAIAAAATAVAAATAASLATVDLRHGKTRQSIRVPSDTSYGDLAAAASTLLRVPVSRLKLVYRGRLLGTASDADLLSAAVTAGGPLLAIGEPEEDEAGLDQRDIALLTKQLQLSHDEAVRALRRHGGDVLDAIRNS